MPEPVEEKPQRVVNPGRVNNHLLQRLLQVEQDLAMAAAYADQVEEEKREELAAKDAVITELQDQLVALTGGDQPTTAG